MLQRSQGKMTHGRQQQRFRPQLQQTSETHQQVLQRLERYRNTKLMMQRRVRRQSSTARFEREPKQMTPPGLRPAMVGVRQQPSRLKTADSRSPQSQRRKHTLASLLVKPVESKSLSAKPASLLLYCFRLLISGLGLAAIVGTVIAIVNPKPQLALVSDTPSKTTSSNLSARPQSQQSQLQSVALNQGRPSLRVQQQMLLHPNRELTAVKTKIQQMAAAQSGLTPGMFFLNPKTGAFLDIAGNEPFAAASTIKLPVLVAFFQAIDAGKIQLDEPLVMRPDLIASEAGVIQYQPPGTKFDALETADLMITISDNTATNMLIDRLGGAAKLNQRFLSWGLTHTRIQNQLPDLEGTNTVSPQDLALLMLKLNEGKLLSPRSRDLALDILRRTQTKTLLPQGLAAGATIAHKTGDIGSVVGDAGLVDMPNKQQYVAAVLVKRPHNDPRAQELIRQISRLTYEAFEHVTPSESGE